MSEGKIVKISNGNRITIPKEACRKIGLKAGDYAFINWTIKDGKLVLELLPAEVKIIPKTL